MKNKLVFVSGMAVGYLLGTRAVRDSYENLKGKVRSFRAPDTIGHPRNKTSEIQNPASPPEKKAKEETAIAPRRDGATSFTSKDDQTKADSPPRNDFYGIGGPATHSYPDADSETAQPSSQDETGGGSRTDYELRIARTTDKSEPERLFPDSDDAMAPATMSLSSCGEVQHSASGTVAACVQCSMPLIGPCLRGLPPAMLPQHIPAVRGWRGACH